MIKHKNALEIIEIQLLYFGIEKDISWCSYPFQMQVSNIRKSANLVVYVRESKLKLDKLANIDYSSSGDINLIEM